MAGDCGRFGVEILGARLIWWWGLFWLGGVEGWNWFWGLVGVGSFGVGGVWCAVVGGRSVARAGFWIGVLWALFWRGSSFFGRSGDDGGVLLASGRVFLLERGGLGGAFSFDRARVIDGGFFWLSWCGGGGVFGAGVVFASWARGFWRGLFRGVGGSLAGMVR